MIEATFLELDPDRRVVQAVRFESDDPAFAGTMTMSWELAETSEGTLVSIRAANVPEGITAEDHAAGMGSSLAHLAAHVES